MFHVLLLSQLVIHPVSKEVGDGKTHPLFEERFYVIKFNCLIRIEYITGNEALR